MRQRRTEIRPGHRGEQQRQVSHRARHRPDDAARVPDVVDAAVGHQPRRRTQADDVVERGGVPDAPAQIGSIGDRQHPGSQRGTGAAAASACRPVQRPGVPRRAEDIVEGVRAGAELGRVGLAHDDRAGRAEPFHDQAVGDGNVVGERAGAVGGADAGRVVEILDRDGQTVQRPERLAARDPAVRLVGVVQRALLPQADNRVDPRVDRVDPLQVRRHHLAGRDLTAADRRGELACRPPVQHRRPVGRRPPVVSTRS